MTDIIGEELRKRVTEYQELIEKSDKNYTDFLKVYVLGKEILTLGDLSERLIGGTLEMKHKRDQIDGAVAELEEILLEILNK